jgi:hypothetical protein
MDDWETLDLLSLWDVMGEQTTAAHAGGFVVPLPGPLRPPDLVGRPLGTGAGAGPQLDGYEDAFDWIERRRRS